MRGRNVGSFSWQARGLMQTRGGVICCRILNDYNFVILKVSTIVQPISQNRMYALLILELL